MYHLNQCQEVFAGRQRALLCPFKQFPQHPQRRMREECRTPLLKTVKLASGKQMFYPYLTYCYLGIELALRNFLKKPNFLLKCNEWRTRSVQSETLQDIYDGNVWTEFQSEDHQRFLEDSNSLGLMLNIDFFQPFKHTTYSVGAIYFAIMNLPRSIRYKSENIILAGVIPGPDEPEGNMNSFLSPLVKELQKLWNGIEIDCHPNTIKTIRSALLCVACDLPAGRKVCGFLSHSATYGCSKCKKEFPGGVGNKDYSGFDSDNWPMRTGEAHRRDALKLKSHRTRAEKVKSESESGCRYSTLLELDYFDAPCFLIVDPMHNLFIGTAKHFLKRIWIDQELISDSIFNKIQDCVNNIVVPAGMGRIPYKIRSGFSSFTSNQWQNWVNYYSLIALCSLDVLNGPDLECWRHFVLASRLLCHKHLMSVDVRVADALLLQFCRRTERLYGKEVITPKMHMHSHLRACVEDYGPLHSFWLYAFERYNGILGNFPNNNRSIEIQLMERFLNDQTVKALDLPDEFQDVFKSHFEQASGKLVGSLSDTVNPIDDSDIVVPNTCKRCVLDTEDLGNLKFLYSKLHNTSPSNIEIPTCSSKYNRVQIRGKQLGSFQSQSSCSSLVIATWRSELFGEPLTDVVPTDPLRVARINYFIQHNYLVNGVSHSQTLVSLLWFKYHPSHTILGKPLSIWCPDLFEPNGLHSMLPISFVRCRCVSYVCSIKAVPSNESVLIVSPCIDF